MVLSSDSSSLKLHDIIIIGAGPCGLAVAARLCERTPSAIFTDDEHQRYNWIRRHAQQMSIKNRKTGSDKPARPPKEDRKYSTLVLDGSGSSWMAKWNRLFKTFDIKHLRSPMFFHVDPGDRDGMLAFTYEEGRENELVEIRGCVGKELSKHQKKKKRASGNAHASVVVEERDRKDYQTPSTPLFANHCSQIIDRYNLTSLPLEHANVSNITYAPAPLLTPGQPNTNIFTLSTSTGTYYSRTIVLALGAANSPSIPNPLPTPLPHSAHAFTTPTIPSSELKRKIVSSKSTHALVIGGGLTSAQLTCLLLGRGVSHVTHVHRSTLKTKPFDVDLAWMGKYRNINQAYFYGAESDEERVQMIGAARGGGSLTPGFTKNLREWENRGRATVLENAVVDWTASIFDEVRGTWTVHTTSTTSNRPASIIENADFVYFATGAPTAISNVPCLQTLLDTHPIATCGGLPCLTDELQWCDDVPLWVTGKLAGLRLGPGAGNLGGARVGAERVVVGVEEWLGKWGAREGENVEESKAKVERRDSAQERDEYTTARGNRFVSLKFADLGDE